MSTIDWNSELPKLEREFDGLPAVPTATRTRTQPVAPKRKIERSPVEKARREQQIMLLAVWARVVLVACLAGGLTVWPYGHKCGWGQFTYLSSCIMLVLGGLWASLHTWRTRMALAHTVALVLLFAGLASVSAQALPRMGYITIDSTRPVHWRCGR